jgi:hypothetical protein
VIPTTAMTGSNHTTTQSIPLLQNSNIQQIFERILVIKHRIEMVGWSQMKDI